MPHHTKIDPVLLKQYLEEGLGTKIIAGRFFCSQAAVSRAKRKLGLSLIRAKGKMVEAAPDMVKRDDDLRQTMLDMITECKDNLEWIADNTQKDATADSRNWQETGIKNMAEIRKTITAIADIEYKLHKATAIDKVLLIMDMEIGNESKELQERIRNRLRKSNIVVGLDG